MTRPTDKNIGCGVMSLKVGNLGPPSILRMPKPTLQKNGMNITPRPPSIIKFVSNVIARRIA